MKQERELNFELLRCILMFMVVVVHYNNVKMGNAFSYVTPGSLNYYFLHLAESLSIIGTNGFVLLTGYFSRNKDRTSLRKPVGLFLYVIAYKVLFYVLERMILKEAFTIKGILFSFVPSNWFIVLYVVLVLLSPYINRAVRELSQKSFLILLIMSFLLFSVWPTILDIVELKFGIETMEINTVSLNGTSSGYSIVNFVMLYLIGAFISRFQVLRYAKRWDVLGYLICTGIIFVQELVLYDGWSYANPFVILSAIFFMNIFRKIQIASRFLNVIAKATLGVYLIHTHSLIWNVLWTKFDIKGACQGSLAECVWNMLLCCFVTYLFCVILDIVGRRISAPVSKLLDTIGILNKNVIQASSEHVVPAGKR